MFLILFLYEITFSDGSKRNGSLQGESGLTTFNQGGYGYNAGASGTYYVGIRPVVTILKSLID